ncbi:zinc-ribbon domain-containing protein [Ktedonosporobacter rubrisoli]|uniref:Zinc-ribbon domain-containing protein n=1 Tax=Ktedonosporobacter rubrisoli TaxID=2509675 RepID=A0A4P6K658_KTERU|nr:zinc ribbon domain-containing protein [Ktedonosporobacter rubrisoli]QBD83056.1 zinc-ribbon domain-containing protein [Ktedonosporobacter rubrisoli]
MATCTSCGQDITGKKFCPQCGTPAYSAGTPRVSGQFASVHCPRCSGEVSPGAAFCMHCGATLNTQAVTAPPMPATRPCPACHAEVDAASAFCTGCGHNMRAPASQVSASAAYCANCGRANNPGVRFCSGCGAPLGASQGSYTQPQSQYPAPPQPQYPVQAQYQPQPQPYAPQPYVQQGAYQPQPMLGQQPMTLRCPVCMAMAPVGTPNCRSCHTSLAGVVPIPANMPVQQGQQGGLGGFLQGGGGQLAAGALGGAAAVIGGQMLLHGLENSIEERVEEDMGYGGEGRRHHHRDEGLLGGLGELGKDIGLF